MMLPGILEKPRVSALLMAGTVDGMVDGQPHALVRERRLRVRPLLRKDQPERPRRVVRLEGQPWCALQLLGQGSPDRVGDVHLAAFERHQPRLLLHTDLKTRRFTFGVLRQ